MTKSFHSCSCSRHHKVGKGKAKKTSLQMTAENLQVQCRCDVVR